MLRVREQCVIRNHLTGTRNTNISSHSFSSHPHTEGKRDRQRQRETGRRREEEECEGEGRQKKCELLLLCDLLKSLGEHSGSVRTKEGGESVLSPLCREQLMLD